MTAAILSNVGGLPFRVVIWFARNPDEELTSEDIATKWPEFSYAKVSCRLRKYRADGVLHCEASPTRMRSGAKELVWSAGPRLLEVINC